MRSLAFDSDGRLWKAKWAASRRRGQFDCAANYGWPKASNGSNYGGGDIPDHKPSDGFEPPKVWWTPSISPGGLLIYSGDKFAKWKGDALVPALSGEALIRVDLNGDRATKAEQWPMGARIRASTRVPTGRSSCSRTRAGWCGWIR